MSKLSLVLIIGLVVLVDFGTAVIWKRSAEVVTDEQLLEEIREHDTDGDGELNLDELMTTLPPGSRAHLTRTKVARIFSWLDTDRNGSLSLSEIKVLMEFVQA